MYNIIEGIRVSNTSNHSYVHKFGANPTLVAGSQTIWTAGGLYPWDAFNTATQISVYSDNSSDTMDMTIYGLDANWESQSETITLAGTTEVQTQKTWKRVFRAFCHDDNVGEITGVVGSDTVLHIEEVKGQTLMALYTVPAGYKCYGLQFTAGVGKGGDAEFRMYTRENDPVTSAFRIRAQLELYETTFTQAYALPVPLPPKTDIDFRAYTGGNNYAATGSFDLLLEKL